MSGGLLIGGGYDVRPVDGDGVNFQFSAQLIPEPSAIGLAVAAMLVAGFVGREIDNL